MEIVSSSDGEEKVLNKRLTRTRPLKRKDDSDSEEEKVGKSQKNFRKKISSKVAGKDFFDFNDGFTKLKPSLSTNATPVLEIQSTTLEPENLFKKEKDETNSVITHVLASDTDGSITPPPAIFEQEELKNVFSRLKNFKPVQNKTRVISLKPKDSSTVKISVIHKTWPETNDNEILSNSVNCNESFRDLLLKLNILLDQEVVLVFKNTRIYPSSTPKSLEDLGFTDSTPLICYSLLDFNSFQTFLSEKKQELLSDQNDIEETPDSYNEEDDDCLNIKILDEFGSTLKLAAKETTLVDQILLKWSNNFNKPLKSCKLKSQGDFITGSLKDADVEDGDVLEIFYI